MSIPQRDPSQTILTLGLELEFLLLNLPPSSNPHALVKHALESHLSVPLTFTSNHLQPPVSLPSLRTDIRLDPVFWTPYGVSRPLPSLGGFGCRTTPRTNTRYNRKRFTLMDENGFDPMCQEGAFGPTQEIGEDGEVRLRQSMEVATPIMREGSWRRVVGGMLESLSTLEDRGLRVEFNANTGLHVHVGRRGGWSVCQLKKILKAVVVFEEAMDFHHPPSRVRSNVDHDAVNIKSNIELMDIGRVSRVNRLKFIDSRINSRNARNRDEGLMRLYTLTNGNSKGTKYNFLPIKECGTVEFRQAVACLDYEQVSDWVDVVLDFVCAAISTTREDFESLAREEDINEDTLDTFLIHGRGYRLCCWGLEDDFEDELPVEEDEQPQSQEGVRYYEDTLFPEDKVVKIDTKGKSPARDAEDRSVWVDKIGESPTELCNGIEGKGKSKAFRTLIACHYKSDEGGVNGSMTDESGPSGW